MKSKVSALHPIGTNDMSLQGGIPVSYGNIKGVIFGGRFVQYIPGTRRLVGVKMAAEIDHPHEISIPTEDFSVPTHAEMEVGMVAALTALAEGNDIYAGCMGGVGRTGLFMGCMAKLMTDYEGGVVGYCDPVKYVRKHYKSHAIETQEQQDFVRTFDTTYLVEFVDALQKPKVVTKEVFLSPWDWWLRFLGFGKAAK